jgi:MoxR-like ATPase
MKAEDLLSKWMRGGAASVTPEGRVAIGSTADSLAGRLRLAYDWIASKAILTSQGDIRPGPARLVGKGDTQVELHAGPCYSSFILLPLLNLPLGRRLVFVGSPGRGKTSVATLMSLISGISLEETRRHIQHGHPQMTAQDLLGGPLPSSLVKAEKSQDVHVEWRGWLRSRVKIIDEYNRIPTKTQSVLLSLLAEGYAESFEQTLETGSSAWYLTANDDLGGGTFPVIEALRDRIDVVVRSAPFQMESLDVLIERLAQDESPEAHIPADIMLTPSELDRMAAQIRAVGVGPELRELIAFVLGQLEFCRRASDRLDYMNKDTLHLAGRRVGQVCTEDCRLDRQQALCAQVESGVSPRALQALVAFSQALAYFQGRSAVDLNDVGQVLPWVLFDKLRPNLQSPFFEKDEHRVLLHDRASWIQALFDLGVQQFASYRQTREQVNRALADAADARVAAPRRQAALERALTRLLEECELNAAVHADIMRLRQAHARLAGR